MALFLRYNFQFIEQMKLGSRLEAAVPKDKIGDVKVMNNEYDKDGAT